MANTTAAAAGTTAAGMACLPIPGATGWLVNFALLWTCAATLLMKKACCETADRTWRAFVLDSSKQLVGAIWASMLAASTADCSLYFATTIVESTAGVMVEYLFLLCFLRVFREATGNVHAFTSGDYFNDSGKFVKRNYVMQLVLWLFCVTLMKSVTAPMAKSYVTPPHDVAGSILEVFGWSGYLEMLVVVMITPCAFRAMQAWLTDDFLKLGGAPAFLPRMLGLVFSRSEAIARRSSAMMTSRSRSHGKSEAAQPLLQASMASPAAATALTPVREEADLEAAVAAAAAAAPAVVAAAAAAAEQPPAAAGGREWANGNSYETGGMSVGETGGMSVGWHADDDKLFRDKFQEAGEAPAAPAAAVAPAPPPAAAAAEAAQSPAKSGIGGFLSGFFASYKEEAAEESEKSAAASEPTDAPPPLPPPAESEKRAPAHAHADAPTPPAVPPPEKAPPGAEQLPATTSTPRTLAPSPAESRQSGKTAPAPEPADAPPPPPVPPPEEVEALAEEAALAALAEQLPVPQEEEAPAEEDPLAAALAEPLPVPQEAPPESPEKSTPGQTPDAHAHGAGGKGQAEFFSLTPNVSPNVSPDKKEGEGIYFRGEAARIYVEALSAQQDRTVRLSTGSRYAEPADEGAPTDDQASDSSSIPEQMEIQAASLEEYRMDREASLANRAAEPQQRTGRRLGDLDAAVETEKEARPARYADVNQPSRASSSSSIPDHPEIEADAVDRYRTERSPARASHVGDLSAAFSEAEAEEAPVVERYAGVDTAQLLATKDDVLRLESADELTATFSIHSEQKLAAYRSGRAGGN